MSSFTNKKVIGVRSSEWHCSKSMEKLKVIQKSYIFTAVGKKYKNLYFHWWVVKWQRFEKKLIVGTKSI